MQLNIPNNVRVCITGRREHITPSRGPSPLKKPPHPQKHELQLKPCVLASVSVDKWASPHNLYLQKDIMPSPPFPFIPPLQSSHAYMIRVYGMNCFILTLLSVLSSIQTTTSLNHSSIVINSSYSLNQVLIIQPWVRFILSTRKPSPSRYVVFYPSENQVFPSTSYTKKQCFSHYVVFYPPEYQVLLTMSLVINNQ